MLGQYLTRVFVVTGEHVADVAAAAGVGGRGGGGLDPRRAPRRASAG